jgi:hypothetical protein
MSGQAKARARWDALAKGTRVAHMDGRTGTAMKRTGRSYVWVMWDADKDDPAQPWDRIWWESVAPGEVWTHWETGMTAAQVRAEQMKSPLASVRARVPHCRAHLESRSDCAECERERETA